MIINQIANPFGKLFYLATNLNKEGRINDEEKGRLKDLIIKEDKLIMDMLNTYNWSQNLQGLENNIVDCILKKKDELEEIASPPNRSPQSRGNSKKPSRVVVPSNRQLSFYNNTNQPAAGIYAQLPIKSMPAINMEDEANFSRKENHSPSLQVLPTYNHSTSIMRGIKSELNDKREGGMGLKKIHTLDVNINSTGVEEKQRVHNVQKVTKVENVQKVTKVENVQKVINVEKAENLVKKVENVQKVGNVVKNEPNVETKKKEGGFQLIITDVRGRSKTEQIEQKSCSLLKPTQLDTIQSASHENDSSTKQINTASLASGKTRGTPLNPAVDSERSRISNNTLKPPMKSNHSVENTPASRLKDSSVISGTNGNNQNNDNGSRRERSLSAFTDESFEPCGFQDYYKAYKKENDIPPSEMGDRDRDNDSSAHLKAPIFGMGLLRRNTVEVNNHGITVLQKPKEIQEITEQMDENASPQDKRQSRKKMKKESSLELAGN